MKSATTVVALVLTLLVWASVAKAQSIDKAQYSIPTLLEMTAAVRPQWQSIVKAQYSIPTPAPDGQASCSLLVSATKDAGAPGTLVVVLYAIEGEAQIPELGLGDGVQDGCNIFPNKPRRTDFALDISGDVFQFEWMLEVHAHPDADCEAGGTAEGAVVVQIRPVGGQVEASLFCE